MKSFFVQKFKEQLRENSNWGPLLFHIFTKLTIITTEGKRDKAWELSHFTNFGRGPQ
ncbi:hypothetical protein LguiB_017927 [Lonicera macranthoides]